jgi:hypothetical protein
MSANWANSLDMLAQNGVLDFDAPSFVTGQAPRYVGAPSAPPSPYVGPPLPSAPALKQPEIDEFHKEKNKIPKNQDKDNDYIKNPSWKKWLFGAVAIGAIGLGIWKFNSASKWVKNKLNNISWKSTKQFFKDKGKTVKKFFTDNWKKFTNLFKKKP